MITTADGAIVEKAPAFMQVQKSDELCYRTEVCTMELQFSEYIQSLIPAAEAFEPGKQLTSQDIDQVIFLIRLLREHAIGQLAACIHSSQLAVDPFFSQQSVPQLVIVHEKDFKLSAAMPVAAYLQRLAGMFHGFEYDATLNSVNDRLFRIGVSMIREDDGKHFLLLPDQKKLLEAARDGALLTAASF